MLVEAKRFSSRNQTEFPPKHFVFTYQPESPSVEETFSQPLGRLISILVVSQTSHRTVSITSFGQSQARKQIGVSITSSSWSWLMIKETKPLEKSFCVSRAVSAATTICSLSGSFFLSVELPWHIRRVDNWRWKTFCNCTRCRVR